MVTGTKDNGWKIVAFFWGQTFAIHFPVAFYQLVTDADDTNDDDYQIKYTPNRKESSFSEASCYHVAYSLHYVQSVAGPDSSQFAYFIKKLRAVI